MTEWNFTVNLGLKVKLRGACFSNYVSANCQWLLWHGKICNLWWNGFFRDAKRVCRFLGLVFNAFAVQAFVKSVNLYFDSKETQVCMDHQSTIVFGEMRRGWSRMLA